MKLLSQFNFSNKQKENIFYKFGLMSINWKIDKPGDSLVVHKNGFDSELSSVFGLAFCCILLFRGVFITLSPDGGFVPLLVVELEKTNKTLIKFRLQWVANEI